VLGEIMSLWFEGYLAFDLVPGCPTEVIDTLAYLARAEEYEFEPPFSHDFFSTEGWRTFLQVKTEPSSLPGMYWSDFRRILRYSSRGEDHYRDTLCFRRLMHDDVEFYMLWWYFLYWIAPYVETVGFVGFYRETFSLHPKPIYLKDGKVYKSDISEDPQGWYEEVWDGDSETIVQPWTRA
jgi:hypothetical protein